MNDSLAKFSRILAGGAMLAFLCAPAQALDVGASVGGLGGASASTGGGGAGAGASVGGTNASASIGGGSASASIGGAPAGTNASASLGNGINANVNAGPANVNIGAGTPAAPDTPGAPGVSNPGLSGVIAGMSDKQLARTKKRCAQVLGSGVDVDADLLALCKLVEMASR